VDENTLQWLREVCVAQGVCGINAFNAVLLSVGRPPLTAEERRAWITCFEDLEEERRRRTGPVGYG